MAKALYGTLFDWIVLQVNHALAMKKSTVIEVPQLIEAVAGHRQNFNMHFVAGILKCSLSNIWGHKARQDFRLLKHMQMCHFSPRHLLHIVYYN